MDGTEKHKATAVKLHDGTAGTREGDGCAAPAVASLRL